MVCFTWVGTVGMNFNLQVSSETVHVSISALTAIEVEKRRSSARLTGRPKKVSLTPRNSSQKIHSEFSGWTCDSFTNRFVPSSLIAKVNIRFTSERIGGKSLRFAEFNSNTFRLTNQTVMSRNNIYKSHKWEDNTR